MAEIKLTKTELRSQQNRQTQLERYLPTLQLKKAMLQAEVQEARSAIAQLEEDFRHQHIAIEHYSSLLTDQAAIEPEKATKILKVNQHLENIAGLDIPVFDSVAFMDYSYSLYDTPPWVDNVVLALRKAVSLLANIAVMKEKKAVIEEELRQVSIRVNLFEKILIPRAIRNIKKIKVFLGDQQLAAVSQAKVAKTLHKD